VRHRSAVRAFAKWRNHGFRAAITPLSAAVHAGQPPPIKGAAVARNIR